MSEERVRALYREVLYWRVLVSRVAAELELKAGAQVPGLRQLVWRSLPSASRWLRITSDSVFGFAGRGCSASVGIRNAPTNGIGTATLPTTFTT